MVARLTEKLQRFNLHKINFYAVLQRVSFLQVSYCAYSEKICISRPVSDHLNTFFANIYAYECSKALQLLF